MPSISTKSFRSQQADPREVSRKLKKISLCVSKGEVEKLWTDLEGVSIAGIKDKDRQTAILNLFLSRCVRAAETRHQECFRTNRRRPQTAKQIETGTTVFWPTKLSLRAACNWTYSQAVDPLRNLDNAHITRAEFLLNSGEYRSFLTNQPMLFAADQQASFTTRFIAADHRIRDRIERSLKRLGVNKCFQKDVDAPAIAAQQIVNAVTEAYGIPFVPVIISSNIDSNAQACFDPADYTIKIPPANETFSWEKQDIGYTLYMLLHEPRHAVQNILADSLSVSRRDGTPINCLRRERVEGLFKYNVDLRRIWLSTLLYNLYSSSDFSKDMVGYTKQTGLIERDAEEFGRDIALRLGAKEASLPHVSKRSHAAIFTADASSIPRLPPAHPARSSALDGLSFSIPGLKDVPLAAAQVMVRATQIEKSPSPKGENPSASPLNGVADSTILLVRGLDPSKPSRFATDISTLHDRVSGPLPGLEALRLLKTELSSLLLRRSVYPAQTVAIRSLLQATKKRLKELTPKGSSLQKAPNPSKTTSSSLSTLRPILEGKQLVSPEMRRSGQRNTLRDMADEMDMCREPFQPQRLAMIIAESRLILQQGLVGQFNAQRILQSIAKMQIACATKCPTRLRPLFRVHLRSLKREASEAAR